MSYNHKPLWLGRGALVGLVIEKHGKVVDIRQAQVVDLADRYVSVVYGDGKVIAFRHDLGNHWPNKSDGAFLYQLAPLTDPDLEVLVTELASKLAAREEEPTKRYGITRRWYPQGTGRMRLALDRKIRKAVS